MTDQGKIKRCTQTTPYCYYISKPKSYIDIVNINWVRLWLNKRRSWERVETFDYVSLMAKVKNTVTGTIKEYRLSFTDMKWFSENLIIIDENLINKIRSELNA